jgi:hypothetical protein
MKSCASGLRVRFFSVMIPTDLCVIGNSMGNFLIEACSA